MRVTIAIDDIWLPLPPMRTPDIRQTVLEIVLELLADSGVDDIHLIIANSLHRRMTDGEMKRMVGEKIFDAFYPDRYYNHDAEDPDGMVELGQHRARRGGRGQPPRGREGPAHLCQHQPGARWTAATSRWASGSATTSRSRAHHNPRDHPRLRQLHGPEALGAEHQLDRAHRPRRRPAHEGLPHRDRAQQPHVRRASWSSSMKNEEDFTEFDRLKLQACATRCRRCRARPSARCSSIDSRRLRGDRRATRARPSRCTRRRSSSAGSSTRCR